MIETTNSTKILTPSKRPLREKQILALINSDEEENGDFLFIL